MNSICNWSFQQSHLPQIRVGSFQQSQKTQMMNRNIAFFCRFCSSQQVNSVTDSILNYSNSGFDLSSFLKTDSTNEFSSSCTTRIVPILTTGVSFLRSYKVSNKRPIMGHPRSDLGQPRSVLVGPGQSQDGLVCLRMVQDSLKPAQVWLG